MYEQLLYPQKHPVKLILFILGIVLLPFSFFEFFLENGAFMFRWDFDIIAFAASIALSVTYFLPTHEKMHFLNIPFITVLVMEFCRFGTVTLLDNEIPFPSYIASAFFMLGSVGTVFLLYFIAEGKIRSRIGLFVWPAFLLILATASLIVGFPPFGVYTEIVKGNFIRNLSGFIQFILFYSAPILIGVALKSDHFPKKQRRRKRKNSSDS
ncbi:MAG: hypothetical protein IJX08_06960 [Clostridia bacterium]|nr:hypothetical protein [Clostridia bacterium]